jgi:hypothetical protein
VEFPLHTSQIQKKRIDAVGFEPTSPPNPALCLGSVRSPSSGGSRKSHRLRLSLQGLADLAGLGGLGGLGGLASLADLKRLIGSVKFQGLAGLEVSEVSTQALGWGRLTTGPCVLEDFDGVRSAKINIHSERLNDWQGEML